MLSKLIEEIVNPTILLMLSVAMVYFLWGVMKFILNMDNETERESGKNHLVWGTVGLVIMFSVWGIIKLIMSLASSL